MKKTKIYCLLLLLLIFSTPALPSQIHISAASSLTDAIKDVAVTYQQAHPQIELLTHFSSSGALAKQIVARAPVDIYISANPEWMEYLQKRGMIAAKTTRTLLHNSLVLVGSVESQISSLADILDMGEIALGRPESVPAGRYAEQALMAANLYQQLQVKNKLILTQDVRQALLYADQGEVAGAFVYQSDALLAKQAKTLLVVPQELYPQVTYQAALVGGAEARPEVQDFFDFLFSPEGAQIFIKYGFKIVE